MGANFYVGNNCNCQPFYRQLDMTVDSDNRSRGGVSGILIKTERKVQNGLSILTEKTSEWFRL